MQVRDAERSVQGRRLQLGEVDGESGVAAVDVRHELGADEGADLLLRLLRRPADVGGQDHVVQPAQRGLERLALPLRLDREHVEGGTRDVAGEDVLAQGHVVDDHAARGVDEQRARLHLLELLVTEEAGVARAPVDVQGHHVRLRQQVVQRRHPLRVAVREPVVGVEVDDPEPDRLGDHGELRADVAVADDPEHPAADLVAAVRGLVPDPVVHPQGLLRQPPRERDDLADHELDHAPGVGVRRVERGHAPARRRCEVDLVGADAERTHRDEVGRRRERPIGQERVRPDAEEVEAGQGRHQLVLGQRPWAGLHLDAGARETLRRGRMDVLQEQGAHAPSL